MLPGRIELPTSALPRMRSTTELRQHGPSRLTRLAGGEVRPMENAGGLVKAACAASCNPFTAGP